MKIFRSDQSAGNEIIKNRRCIVLFSISAGDVNWIFDKIKGKIACATYKTDTVLNNGAELMILPLHSEECKTEHSLNIPFINNTCTDWKVDSVVSAEAADTIKVTVKGTYKEAEIALDYYFLKEG